ncbi:hypothetical protein M5X06_08750 [Paenibacillus alvei]|uniref:Uncharacterized protein n=1 Tax=Paenibacillus alvei TaxID=44250 RepID=A0AAP7A0J3_PAEAL|nr:MULTISPECIES: hypothetical protein [Paenibacillus]MBG9733317.1 hypothetical protein [Paenibacillus alvei]MBG9745124.1 hypothetical protein [Paenibacillus alvei]MCY7487758.1 hypothetical protein [Paenibacillus alvei]MCY9580749.1 hypothetical protein [Paenibacillus alvei]MCY9585232.1 hypothetical protein [Paenibacillus alvei]
MQSNILILEKMPSGELVKIDERAWTSSMVQLLEHANYLLVNDVEYEMLEGRLNVNTGNFELLVESARKP